jgi:hypothetical protein
MSTTRPVGLALGLRRRGGSTAGGILCPVLLGKRMCEGCGLKRPSTGLASEGKARWCAGCEAAEGAVRLLKNKMCEGCGLNQPHYGLASEGKVRWCAGCGGCGAAKGAVLLHKQKMCEGCGLKQPGYGLASEGQKRWCAGCGEAKGAVLLGKREMCIEKRSPQRKRRRRQVLTKAGTKAKALRGGRARPPYRAPASPSWCATDARRP